MDQKPMRLTEGVSSEVLQSGVPMKRKNPDLGDTKPPQSVDVAQS